jgi:hypothetical protein
LAPAGQAGEGAQIGTTDFSFPRMILTPSPLAPG